MNCSHHRLALLTTTGAGLCGALVLAACAARPRGDDSLPLPGDDLVPEATMIETHQIDIDAPVAAVWPWLVQLGYERGGFYSFDLLERRVWASPMPDASSRGGRTSPSVTGCIWPPTPP